MNIIKYVINKEIIRYMYKKMRGRIRQHKESANKESAPLSCWGIKRFYEKEHIRYTTGMLQW